MTVVVEFLTLYAGIAFSASRVYALIWHQDRFHALTIAVLALGLVSIVINVVSHNLSRNEVSDH